MADKKISALTGATTPLAGTEVLPIVQSGATVKVSVDNLTAGKTVNTGDVIAVKTSSAAVTDGLTVQNLASAAGTEAGIFFSPTTATGNIRGARITGINDGSNVIGLKFYTGTGAAITSKFEMTADGNLAVSTAGKGIDFSANTHAAGMTSELLNDYEEGTFTATLAGFTTSPTVPVTATSRYTKVGRTVTAQIAFRNVSTVGASGPILIQGLPYAAGADAIATAAQSGMGSTNVTAGLLGSGGTTIELIGAAAFVNISFTAGVGQYLFLNITYTV